MQRHAIILAGAISLLAARAWAQSCPAYPVILANGQTADATQVMSNFDTIMTCANGLLTNPTVTGTLYVNAPVPGDAIDTNGVGRFTAPGPAWGSTGAVVIKDAPGDPGYAILQFTNNADTAQLGVIEGVPGPNNGIAFLNGSVGIGTTDPILPLFVSGSAGGTTAWSNLSDARLKQNIATIPDALALILKLRGVSFDWRPPSQREVGGKLKLPLGVKQYGFVAQEVQKVAPEAVVAPAQANEPLAVSEGVIVPILVEAVKAEQAEINELKAQLAAVRARR